MYKECWPKKNAREEKDRLTLDKQKNTPQFFWLQPFPPKKAEICLIFVFIQSCNMIKTVLYDTVHSDPGTKYLFYVTLPFIQFMHLTIIMYQFDCKWHNIGGLCPFYIFEKVIQGKEEIEKAAIVTTFIQSKMSHINNIRNHTKLPTTGQLGN